MKHNIKKLMPVILAILVAVAVLSVYSRQLKKQNVPEIKTIESLSEQEKDAFDLSQSFGEFYYLDKNITVERVKELRDIFAQIVQEDLGITDNKIEEYVQNIQLKNTEIEFIEAKNPRILKSEGNSVILSVDLLVNVISNEEVKSGVYEETVTLGVEDNVIMAFKPGDVIEVK